MRIFVAIEIEEALRQKLAAAEEKLKTITGIKWVEPENFHLTLRFLGWTEEGVVSRLVNELAAVAAATPCFSLRFAGAGVFPNERRPRVVWIGIDQGLEPLFVLAQRAEAICQKLGFEPETRPFSAHMTLGRAKGTFSVAELQKKLEGFSGEVFGTQQVDQITVMQSTLMRSGPIYKPLHRLALQK